MNGIHFTDIKMFLLLWLLPLLALLFFYAATKRKKALAAFMEPALAAKCQHGAGSARRGSRFILFCAATACLVIALARPAWNLKETTVQRSGRDLVFMLDVSKSMLATDLLPNRLERAKIAIRDCVEKLRGDRIALVAFAGVTAVKCPLTQDYGFFLMLLDAIDSDSIGRGGTLLGDALRTTLQQVFDDQDKQFKDIILITDGEDHESFPVQAAQKAGEAGIRLLIIGLGDEGEGERIPVTSEAGERGFLKYDGREVWSRLDGTTLRQMADATPGGRYLPVATGTVDLGEVYLDLVASADRKELESKTIKRYEEKFQIFVAAALVLLAAEALLGRLLVLGALCLLPLLHPDYCLAASPRSLINSGNQAYSSGSFSEADKFYDQALASQADDPAAPFNKGDSLYRQGKFAEAEKVFTQAAANAKDKNFLARSWFNQGNARFRLAAEKKDLKEKLADLKESAGFYQQALRHDATLAGAGRNLEICRRNIKEIEQQLAGQRKNPQEQDQQDQRQKQDTEQNQGQQEERQRSENPPNKRDGGEQPEQREEAGQPGDDQKQEQNQQREQNEQGSSSQPEQGRQSDSARNQQGEANQSAEQARTGQEKEIAEQTVEAILEAEKKLQAKRMQRLRLQSDPVEKDW
ncbi:MAG: VWA domain-containing protein [Deltaproteobacteria bacterium]|nr:VWA domain-containing protein [Deltaproteobacteria bacterium]